MSVPTAKEFWGRDESGVYTEMDIYHALIEFAKLHCEAQRDEINDVLIDFGEEELADSIKNAYPLTLIK